LTVSITLSLQEYRRHTEEKVHAGRGEL
jgi:hypothetical protein